MNPEVLSRWKERGQGFRQIAENGHLEQPEGMRAFVQEGTQPGPDERQTADSRSLTCLDIGHSIADEDGGGEIKIQLGRRLQDQSGSRFAAGTPAAGEVRAQVNAIDSSAGCDDLVHQPMVDLMSRCQGEEPTGHGRLIRDNHDAQRQSTEAG
jgi:hypothetical protein